MVEGTLGEPVVHGAIGLEAGSGNGRDTCFLGRRHPATELISLDMSEGVYQTRRRTSGLPNIHVVRASVLALPVKSRSAILSIPSGYCITRPTLRPACGKSCES